MLTVLPFCARDKALAVRLAELIAELGGVKKHDCLLAVHKDTDSEGVIEPLTGAFGRIAEFSVTDEMIVEREQHTYAANLMWKRTVNHIADMNESQPFLWLEPDAVPLSPAWLDAIASAYASCGKPFLHDLVKTPRGKSNSGCGVYPAKVRDYTDRLWQLSNVSWDVLLYDDFAPHTTYTPLIQDIGFLEDGKTLPTFPDQASLSIIQPGAALFHRCKDGTLIDRLREKNGNASVESSTGPVGVAENASSNLAVAAFTYTFDDLVSLRRALEANDWRISSALTVFGSSDLPWLEFAEQIKDDHGFPEKHFKKMYPTAEGVAASVPEQSGNKGVSRCPPPLKPPRHRGSPMKRKGAKPARTPEQQAIIDARMAKVRAGRKVAA